MDAIPPKDLITSWMSGKSNNLVWAESGVQLSRQLRKKDHCQDAIFVCLEVLKLYPSNKSAQREYGWCIYAEYIKRQSGNHSYSLIAEKAYLILKSCEVMEPFSAYTQVCLRMAELADNESMTCDTSEKWLGLLYESKLDNKPFSYTPSRKTMQYWSQLRRFLEIKMRHSSLNKDYDLSVGYGIRIYKECANSTEQNQHILSDIYSDIQSAYSLSGDDLIERQ